MARMRSPVKKKKSCSGSKSGLLLLEKEMSARDGLMKMFSVYGEKCLKS